MHDFPRLLLNASRTMGTPLAVAQLLQVQPRLVYRWMAELERPSGPHVAAWRERLEVTLREVKAPASHPRRRAADARLRVAR